MRFATFKTNRKIGVRLPEGVLISYKNADTIRDNVQRWAIKVLRESVAPDFSNVPVDFTVNYLGRPVD